MNTARLLFIWKGLVGRGFPNCIANSALACVPSCSNESMVGILGTASRLLFTFNPSTVLHTVWFFPTYYTRQLLRIRDIGQERGHFGPTYTLRQRTDPGKVFLVQEQFEICGDRRPYHREVYCSNCVKLTPIIETIHPSSLVTSTFFSFCAVL
jgi:hypothetical protein